MASGKPSSDSDRWWRATRNSFLAIRLHNFFCCRESRTKAGATTKPSGSEDSSVNRGLVEKLARENMRLHKRIYRLQEFLKNEGVPLQDSDEEPIDKRPTDKEHAPDARHSYEPLQDMPASAPVLSSRPSAKPKGKPVQVGMWPSANPNVDPYKNQTCSREDRERRDILNNKTKRRRHRKQQWVCSLRVLADAVLCWFWSPRGKATAKMICLVQNRNTTVRKKRSENQASRLVSSRNAHKLSLWG